VKAAETELESTGDVFNFHFSLTDILSMDMVLLPHDSPQTPVYSILDVTKSRLLTWVSDISFFLSFLGAQFRC